MEQLEKGGAFIMMLHNYLYNPIPQTAVMEDEDFLKYVDICNRQSGATASNMVEEINNQFSKFAEEKGISKSRIEGIMGFIGPKIVTNEGLARFILDYNGAKSDYFFPWLINVHKSPSAALEMAYGAGDNLAGKWVEDILGTDDPIEFFIMNDPTFIYNRERELYMAELVSRVQYRSFHEGRVSKIVDYGAGRLAWARWHGVKLSSIGQEIYAFDRDPTINPDGLFTAPLSELGIHYRHGDVFAQLNNYQCNDADLISLLGLVSYLPRDAFETKVLPAIHRLLNVNGMYFFDLQLDCPYYRRSMRLWNWPEIDLQKDVSSAIAMIEKIRKDLWSGGYKFSAEYIPDTYNSTPSSLMVTLTKLS